ncbi:Catechol 2,3-dioxygenase [Streptomyces sp. TLI_053]|uniref:VOC family protein n=1 Tax=Streptomyces sp. TLI_053 TaxID=1855352 RepID=UPI00087B81D5|nr:VOC family protein [Streptomyces sp. TLI_053]SDT75241.1 Catechol 2,3-dioxygenase [Streptomyces sp. TLI_053]
MLTRVMYVTVYVTDQDRALRFYTEQLGLEKRVDYAGPDGRFLTVGAEGHPFEIILWPHAPAAGQPSRSEEVSAPGPIVLESDDLRKDVGIWRERGVELDRHEPEEYPFGLRVEARDPDGNRVSLRQQRPVLADRA